MKDQGHSIAVAVVYNPPRDSEYFSETLFDDLSRNLSELETNHNCKSFIIGGDFNARIGSWQNFTEETDPEEWEDNVEVVLSLKKRESKDEQVNTSGRDLIRFCQAQDLVVVNGSDQKMDSFLTFISSVGGGSVIDIVLTSVDVYKKVVSLKVLDSPISHHLPVGISLKKGVVSVSPSESNIEQDDTSYISLERHQWKNDEESLSYVSDRMDTLGHLILPAVTFFSSIGSVLQCLTILKTLFCLICNKFKLKSESSSSEKTRKSPWFNDACFQLKRKTVTALKNFRRLGGNNNLNDFLQTRKLYNDTKKQAKKEYWEEKIRSLSHACKSSNNKSSVWKEIKFHTGRVKSCVVNSIKGSDWVKHFDKILNKSPKNKKEWSLQGREENRDAFFEEPIRLQEVQWSLGRIKHGKSPGPDRILGDFLKFFKFVLAFPLTKLFNFVWETAAFPVSWAQSIIVPLHKKGSTTDPNNYRGIALLSHLGKIFTRILNKRLAEWVQRNNLLSDCQAGFRKGYSAIDNIFILDTLVQERLQKKGCALYCCFVDLKKAFDWVDRGALFYKLWRLGLPEKMLSILKDYYNKSEFAVRQSPTKITTFQKSVSGVFQGCQLSPQLFTLFINDIVSVLGELNMHAPEIDGTSVHALLYADDLVLISQSPVGLQRMLNRLEKYCSEWDLEVNMDKSKVLVFKKGNKLAKSEKWYFLRKKLEVVSEYKYLGVLFKSNGGWTKHIEEAKVKADRACTSLLKFVYKFRKLPVSFFLRLFDSLVNSVLLYGSEVWSGGLLSDRNNSLLESVALRFYKSMLGLPRGTPSDGVLLELSRIKVREQSIINMVRFWLRISALPESRLVKKCLKKQTVMANNGKQCWALQVKSALECLGFASLWNREGILSIRRKTMMSIIKQKVRDISRTTLFEHIKEKSSLVFYEKYKTGTAPGHDYDTFSPQDRRWLAIVRLNLKRSLPVETKDGAVKCQICEKTISREEEILWKHFFISGCKIVENESNFFPSEGYNDIVEMAIKNSTFFLEQNKVIIKKLKPSS